MRGSQGLSGRRGGAVGAAGAQVLDALAANLAAEQQELAHQDFVLFRQLLSPVQVRRSPPRPPSPDIAAPALQSLSRLIRQICKKEVQKAVANKATALPPLGRLRG